MPDVTVRFIEESCKLLLKNIPTQAETPVHCTALCDDSSGLQAFQKMRHRDEALPGCMKKFDGND